MKLIIEAYEVAGRLVVSSDPREIEVPDNGNYSTQSLLRAADDAVRQVRCRLVEQNEGEAG